MRKILSGILVGILLLMLPLTTLQAAEYVVKKGDVLWKIGREYDVSWEDIAKDNKLKNPHLIFPGQRLQINVVKAEEVVLEPDTVDITILSTSDMHGNIMGYVYEDAKYSEKDGLARISTYVKSIREENPNTIVIDNGDTVQGNILTDDILAKDLDKKNTVIEAMNLIGYDLMVLGNHEFNFGLEVVEKIKEEATFDVLGANIYLNEERMAKAYSIIEKEGVKIAIIGISSPNILKWDGDKLDGVTTTGVEEEVKRQVDYIKANEDCDLIIVAAHVSETAEFYDGTNRDAGLGAIDAYPELELLILGHAHKTLNYVKGNTAVVSTNNNAREVAKTDLTFVMKEGQWVIDYKEAVIVSMEDIERDQAVVDLATPIHEETITYISGGSSGEEGGEITPIAISTAKFQPENELVGLPQGKLQDTPVIDLINNVQLDITGADVSAAALFKDTSDLPEGNITYANIFDIYKFANLIYTVEITGAQLKDYMEWSAKHYNQAVEGDISVSFNPEVPGYLYDMFQGVDYKIDVSKPVGQRIVDLTFKEMPLADDQILTLAVNNYRFSGLTSEGIITNDPIWTSPLSIRDYIKAYMEEEGTISPSVDNNWEVIGIDYNHPRRQEIIKMINENLDEGVTDDRYDKAKFYNESINVNDH